MGVVYGVDVRDGGGVRPTTSSFDDNGGYEVADASGVFAPQLSLSKLDAFEGIVATQIPLLVGEIAGLYPPANQIQAVTLNILTVGEMILDVTADITFVIPDVVNSLTTIDLALTVDPSVVADERVVPLETNGFTIPDWFAVSGMPQKRTGLVVKSQATAYAGALKNQQIYPDPRDVLLPASLRWIADEDHLDLLNTTWAPYSRTTPSALGLTVWQLAQLSVLETQTYTVDNLLNGAFIVLQNSRDYVYSQSGVNPTFLGEYSYWRAGDYVRAPSLSFRGGDHMWCDTINWNAEELTVIAVAVLHRPQKDWCGLLETQGTNAGGLDPFFGLRYRSSGELVLWADSALLTIPLDTGETRPSQPVVFGFNIDMVANTCSLLSVDRVVKVQTTALPHRYDNRSRLWIGRSPNGEQAAANMDLLEFATFDYKLEEGQLPLLLARYDQMYGVSAS